ncbi:hypothetical protein NPIL_698081 [Nephila pilipes]|uniref:Uncharacterized protein n=1 Tax=Nephila pilipes TaxID=299642 RepID=A0A8X6QWC8_NEPPI|nr:hypothetical protein NPIL_698081 [Nephila pilipes]
MTIQRYRTIVSGLQRFNVFQKRIKILRIPHFPEVPAFSTKSTFQRHQEFPNPTAAVANIDFMSRFQLSTSLGLPSLFTPPVLSEQ